MSFHAGTPRPPSDPEGPTGRLASWVAQTSLGDVPGEVVQRAKHLLLDGVGCALVGARLPTSVTAVDALCPDEPGGAALIGWGERTTSPSNAALLNSSFIQGFELDDYHPVAPLHSNSLLLPAMLAALGGRRMVRGEDLLRGAVLGYEVGPRVGFALHGLDMLSRGWHSGPVFGTHAAAAAVGALYRLDPAAVEDALGMAATQAGGLMAAQFGSDVKRMQHGFAARAGLTAARLAAGGYVGIKRVYETTYGGFLAVFGEGHDPDPSRLTAGLGEDWQTLAIAVKPYAAMGATHAAVDAALQLRTEVAPDRIAHICVEVGAAAFHHGGWRATRPLAVIGAQMNIGYVLAVALLDGQALPTQFSPARVDAPDVWRLIERTTVRHQPAFDDLPEEQRLTTRVTLGLDDDTTRVATVTCPRGTGDRALSNQEIVTKYRSLTDSVLDPRRRADLERCILTVEAAPDLDELVALLAATVGTAPGFDHPAR